MNIIKSKLSKINSNWNDFYFVKEFFQKKINFTDEVRTNYYGDLNNYFHDTLSLVKPFKKVKYDDEHISQSIVLLQVIYVHQDLIDELLYIFKLQKSTNKDKNPNRNIRNELIGHPISRDKGNSNKLKSSILYDIRNEDENYISYAKYSMQKSELKKYSISEVIKNHKRFLIKYLNKILIKMEKEIREYQSLLEKVFEIPMKRQFDYIYRIDKELLSSNSYIFEKDSLTYYYKNMRKHRRYLYCLKQYKRVLYSIIKKTIVKTQYYSMLDTYDQEQLQKKSRIFTIDFYIEKYNSNKIVLKELKNMKHNINNDIEYYASLNFLCENERKY